MTPPPTPSRGARARSSATPTRASTGCRRSACTTRARCTPRRRTATSPTSCARRPAACTAGLVELRVLRPADPRRERRPRPRARRRVARLRAGPRRRRRRGAPRPRPRERRRSWPRPTRTSTPAWRSSPPRGRASSRLDSVDDPRLDEFVAQYQDGPQAPEAGASLQRDRPRGRRSRSRVGSDRDAGAPRVEQAAVAEHLEAVVDRRPGSRPTAAGRRRRRGARRHPWRGRARTRCRSVPRVTSHSPSMSVACRWIVPCAPSRSPGARGANSPRCSSMPSTASAGSIGPADAVPAVHGRLLGHPARVEVPGRSPAQVGQVAVGVHRRQRLDEPRSVGLEPARQLVALGGLRALLEAHPVAGAVLHLRPVPRVDAGDVVQERGAVPRRAGGHAAPAGPRGSPSSRRGRVRLRGGRCGWRGPCRRSLPRVGEDGGVIVDCAVYTDGKRRDGELPLEQALEAAKRARQLRVDRPARAVARGVRGGARGVRPARPGGGGRHHRPPAAEARGVRRRPLRGAQDGSLRRRRRDGASSPSSSSSSARATSSRCATARPAPWPRCGAPSSTTSAGSAAARWRCSTR